MYNHLFKSFSTLSPHEHYLYMYDEDGIEHIEMVLNG